MIDIDAHRNPPSRQNKKLGQSSKKKKPPHGAFFYKMKGNELVTWQKGVIRPTEQQDLLARVYCQELNTNYSLGGSWVVCYLHPVEQVWDRETRLFHLNMPTLMEIGWYDADGDLQFIVDSERSVYEHLNEGIVPMLEHCQRAWEHWDYLTRKVLEVKPHETYKAAQGEIAPSQRPR